MVVVRTDAVAGNDGTSRPLYEIIFVRSGALVVETSTKYYPPLTARLYRLTYSLAVGTTGTFTVSRNGTVLTTVVMSAANGIVVPTEALFAADADYLTVSITNVGSGSVGLTVQALFR